MKRIGMCCALGVAVTGAVALRLNAQPAARAGGADIIVGDLPSLNRGGKATVNSVVINGYSVGTVACNIGDASANWIQNTNQHPVILQNMYRLKNGRFEQVGMSWGKHGFLVEAESLCATCSDLSAFDHLPPGCSDLYAAVTNAMVSRLGPRSTVNAATGVNTWPTLAPTGSSSIKGLIQVKEPDLDPTLNLNADMSPARYFVEGHYVIVEDSAAGTANNNASWKEIDVFGDNFTHNYGIEFVPGATTHAQMAAINAWKSVDPGVTLVNADIPSDGRMTLGTRVTDNGDGTWHYEYALYNMNSDRSGASFSIPVPAGVLVTNIGFHDVDYHSGDGIGGVNYDGTDWPAAAGAGAVAWQTTDFATNQNANALRFATLYNFRFDANSAPTAVNATVGLFKPGSPTSILIAASGPRVACAADINGDGVVNSSDLGLLLGGWGPVGGPADLNHDGAVNSSDLGLMLGGWGPCPT